MNLPAVLNEIEVEEIRKLAKDKREYLGLGSEGPLAQHIFRILEKLDIKLLEYPVGSDGDSSAFSASIIYSEEEGEQLTFIGLNTADYFDKQIFALAHELYHYFTKSSSHIGRVRGPGANLVEAKANRFAAEFILPEIALKSIVIDEFKKSKLYDVNEKVLLRFIVRLQCNWWLPYKSIVKRLKEISAISAGQYKSLMELNVRNWESSYSKMGLALDIETYRKLNSRTNKIGTSAENIEIVIKNFEDGLIDEDKFADVLELFGKSPADFGYETIVYDEELDDFQEFLVGENL